MRSDTTIIIPAHNEAQSIGATLESLGHLETTPAAVIVAADNCTDRTADIARSFPGVQVYEVSGGSKAAAQNAVLGYVRTPYVLPLDADTQLSENYLTVTEPKFADSNVSIVAGAVLTQKQNSVWEKGRQLEYLMSFGLLRRIQQMTRSVTFCSGCCTLFRVTHLLEQGGFPESSLTEDVEYGMRQHRLGRQAVYVPQAAAYADEPDSLKLMLTQGKRWSSGNAQSLRKHLVSVWRKKPLVALWLSLQIFERLVVPFLLVALLATHTIFQVGMMFLASDLVVLWLPVFISCIERKINPLRALTWYPAWYAIKAVNLYCDLKDWLPEFFGLRKPFTTYVSPR